MRPAKLTMQAFGSYGQKTVIDFTAPEQNLFLITGDTGAGKTTIFDAIVFALYGEASSAGNKKNGAELQSQYSAPDAEPYVELVFSERNGNRDEQYCVRRVPRHQRPSKRRNGRPVNVKESISLLLPDGTEYSGSQKETDEKLQEIVGLTKSQFMQVAMIAQGEFMEFLRAESGRKKEIFRKLFGTETFEKIVEELKRRRDEKRSAMEQIHIVCQRETARTKIPEGREDTGLLQELKARTLDTESLNVADMEAFLKELERFCDGLLAEKEAAQGLCEQKKQQRDRCRDEVVRAQNLVKSFEQLREAERILSQCREKEPRIREAAEKIVRIRAAYEVFHLHQRYSDACQKVVETEEHLKERQQALPSLKMDSLRKAKEEKTARDLLDRKLQHYATVSERVQKAQDVFRRIRMAAGEVREGQKELEAAGKQLAQAEKTFEELQARELLWRRQAEELADASALYDSWQKKTEEAEQIALDVEQIRDAEKETEKQRQRVVRAQGQYTSARERFQEKNAEYVIRQTAFLDMQAGLLAARLQEGKPCPVCGSLEHPHPCTLSVEHENLTREMLDALAGEVSAWDQKQHECAAQAAAAAELLKEKESAMGSMLKRLRLRMAGSVPDMGTQELSDTAEAERILKQWKTVLETEGAERKKRLETLGHLQQSLKEAAEQKPDLLLQVDHARQRAMEAQKALTAGETLLKSLEAQKEYPTEQAAVEALQSVSVEKEEQERICRTALQQSQDARAAVDRTETLIRQFEESLPSLLQERSQREREYQERMKEGFADGAEWKEWIQQYDLSETENLQRQVEEFQRLRSSAEGARETAGNAVGDEPEPVMDILEKKQEDAEAQLAEAQVKLEALKDIWKTNREICDLLVPEMKARSRSAREYARIDSLYQRLAGKRTGARMDIETFVQRYYLQQILRAANQRFLEMSAGQFELRMTGEDRAGEGRNRGLELQVFSHATGKVREIRTLSGGESFMAALSLAMGMADQIQENSASVHLDILFVDEGFGSLDEHSRNQAVRVLQRMAGGTKLIGIISHVTELKQEIEDQLIVSKDEEGSHVRWQIS